MALDMTGPGTGGGALSSLAQRATGRGGAARVSRKRGPLADLYLSQLIPALLIVIIGLFVFGLDIGLMNLLGLFMHVAN